MLKPTKIIIHCSDSGWGDVAEIDKWHKERGWDGIGYHFVVLNGMPKNNSYNQGLDGMIQYGRSLDKPGAHTLGQNSSSIGICMIGKKKFSILQFKSLAILCKSIIHQYKMQSYDVCGHYDFSSKTCPNFNVDKFIDTYIDMENVRDLPDELTVEQRVVILENKLFRNKIV